MGFLWDLSSDKPRYLLKMAIEIVDLPINSMVDLSIVTLTSAFHRSFRASGDIQVLGFRSMTMRPFLGINPWQKKRENPG
jgi:hypothetical protein